MKKRLIALTLALALACTTLLATAEGLLENIHLDSLYPIVNNPVKLKIAVIPQWGSATENPDDFWIVRYWKERTNLDIEWEIIAPNTANERIPLMLNIGDMPDALLGYSSMGYEQMSQYGLEQGLFYPVDELLPYMPVFSALLEERPDYRAAITADDGKIYGLPMLSDGGYSAPLRFFINVDWLKALDLELPTTHEAFYQVLKAFKEKDPNGNGQADEIPFSGSWNDGYPERAWILNGYGFTSTSKANIALDYMAEKPEVVYMPRTEKYKDFLTFMNKLWNEGLLDPDMFTQTDVQYDARVLEGRVGFGAMAAPLVNYPSKPEAYEASYPLAAEGGMQLYTRAVPVSIPGMAVINAKIEPEKAAALANFFDTMFDRDEYVYSRWGLEKGGQFDTEGYGYYYDAEKDDLAFTLPEGVQSSWNWMIDMLTFWKFPGYLPDGNDAYELSYIQDHPESELAKYLSVDGGKALRRMDWLRLIIERDYPFGVADMPGFFMTSDDLNRVNELIVPLDDYVASMEAKFITGMEPLDNIQAFWDTLDQMHAQEYVDIYARYYAGYQEKMAALEK